MTTDKTRLRLINEVSDRILEVANLYTEVTTSDLQGIAQAEASKLIDYLEKYFKEVRG